MAFLMCLLSHLNGKDGCENLHLYVLSKCYDELCVSEEVRKVKPLDLVSNKTVKRNIKS